MREIKFRAWDKKNKKWLFWSDFSVNGSGEIIHRHTTTSNQNEYWVNCKELVLVEFTGLYDKNGKEIYENDIVRMLEWHMEALLVVEWEEDHAKFILTDLIENELNFPAKYDIEVIGNRYENPEYLK